MEGKARLALEIDGRSAVSGASEVERELGRLKGAATSADAELRKIGKGQQGIGETIVNLRRLRSETSATASDLKAAANSAQRLDSDLGKMKATAGLTTRQINELRNSLRGQIAETRAAATAAAEAEAMTRRGGMAYAMAGQQIQDMAIMMQMGAKPATILTQQGLQLAFALKDVGGTAGKVASFFAGGWGTAIALGVVAIDLLTKGLFDNSEASKELEEQSKALAERQLDVGNFFDTSTGKIKENSRALIENAKAQIYNRTLKLKDGLTDRKQQARDIVSGSFKRPVTGYQTVDSAEGTVTVPIYGPVNKDLAKALAMPKVSDRLAAISAISRSNSSNAGAAGQLSDLFAQQALDSREIGNLDKFLKSLETGTLDKSLRDAPKGRGGSGRPKRSTGNSDAKKAADEAAEVLKKLDDNLADLTKTLDPGKAALDAYADSLKKIAELKSKGKLSEGDAVMYSLAAGGKYQDSETKRIRSETQEFYKNLGIDVQGDFNEVVNRSVNRWENGLSDGARNAGDVLEAGSVTAAQAFAQVVGGKLGGTIQQLLGVVEGLNSGNFNSVGGRAGGLLTLLGGKANKDKNGNPTGFLAGYSQFGKDIKKTFTDIFGGEKGLFSGALGKTLGKAFAGAQLGGAIGNGVTKALGLKSSKLGGQVGGAIGGAVGGPLGSIIGGTIGSAVGGLFKKSKTTTATLNFSGGELGFAQGGNSNKFAGQATSGAKGIISGLQAIVDQIGGTITGAGSVSIGVKDGKYFVDPTGRGQTKTKKGAIAFGEDEAAAIKYAILDAVKDGAITGLREGTRRLLTGGKDLDSQFTKAQRFENVFRELKQRTDPLGAGIEDLNKEFEGLMRVFKEAGASAAEYADLQKLYEMKRVDVIQQANNQMLGSMRDYLNALRGGSDSPLSAQLRLGNTRAELDRLDALRSGGKAVDFETYRTAADAFLSASRDFNGSSLSYFSDFQRVTSTVEQLLTAQTDKANQQLASIDFSGVIGAVDNQTNVTTALLTQINANLQAALGQGGVGSEAAAVAAGGSSGFRYLERYYKAY